jgi:hypothetical protein
LNLAALREHRQALLRVVEVPELNALERALSDSDLQEQVERQPVAAVVLSEDRSLLIGRERGPLDAAFFRRSDRPRGISVQLAAENCPLKEAFDDRDVLGLRP